MSFSISSYIKDIPSNTFEEAVKCGTIGFLAATILSGNLSYGVTSGGLNFVATVVHGVISPLFQKLLNKNSYYSNNSYLEEMLKTSTAVLVTGFLANQAGYGFALRYISTSLIINCLFVGLADKFINIDYCKVSRAHLVFV